LGDDREGKAEESEREALEVPQRSSQNELILGLMRKIGESILVWMPEQPLKPLLHMRHPFLIYLALYHSLGINLDR
jgi:hypothetical protein